MPNPNPGAHTPIWTLVVIAGAIDGMASERSVVSFASRERALAEMRSIVRDLASGLSPRAREALLFDLEEGETDLVIDGTLVELHASSVVL